MRFLLAFTWKHLKTATKLCASKNTFGSGDCSIKTVFNAQLCKLQNHAWQIGVVYRHGNNSGAMPSSSGLMMK